MEKIMKDCNCIIELDDGKFFCKYFNHNINREIPCNDGTEPRCLGYEKKEDDEI
jgi:hypothetical protein